jgi:hypothetical protein
MAERSADTAENLNSLAAALNAVMQRFRLV